MEYRRIALFRLLLAGLFLVVFAVNWRAPLPDPPSALTPAPVPTITPNPDAPEATRSVPLTGSGRIATVTPFEDIAVSALGADAFVDNWFPGIALFDYDRDWGHRHLRDFRGRGVAPRAGQGRAKPAVQEQR